MLPLTKLETGTAGKVCGEARYEPKCQFSPGRTTTAAGEKKNTKRRAGIHVRWLQTEHT